MARNGRNFQGLAVGLASGLTVQAAAEHAGVSVRTAFRALKHPKFVAKVRGYRDRKAPRMSAPAVPRTVLPIPRRPHVGLTTYDAKDPDTAFPPIEPLRPPEVVHSDKSSDV